MSFPTKNARSTTIEKSKKLEELLCQMKLLVFFGFTGDRSCAFAFVHMACEAAASWSQTGSRVLLSSVGRSGDCIFVLHNTDFRQSTKCIFVKLVVATAYVKLCHGRYNGANDFAVEPRSCAQARNAISQ